ncbi:MAG: succinylglutamate desuccinylase/aspartoacylase family protein [Cyclobacteriaceae bacterium]
MIKITNSYTQQTHEVDRIIGEYRGEQPGSQVLIFTAVHGNEPSGVFAMLNVFQKLHQDRPPMRGTITGICGNLRALEQGERYLEEDMNRMFTPERAQKILSDGAQHTEEEEMKTVLELTRAYQELEDEIFFVDCHTTSSHTEPYISLNAGYPLSYDFARGIPLCAVVGVERMLKGCLSEYLNKQDFHGFTYEAGQHDAKETIDCQEAMIWMALSHAGCLPVSYPAVEEAERTLSLHADKSGKLLKVTDAHAIAEGEQFVMKGGFHNLDPVRKDQHLAWSNDKELFAPADGRILMPLYQKKGNFGYFMTTEVDVKTFVHEAREKAYAS